MNQKFIKFINNHKKGEKKRRKTKKKDKICQKIEIPFSLSTSYLSATKKEFKRVYNYL
jgi:hypothetical protein